MKKNYFWSVLALVMAVTLSVGFSSCKKEENPELSVNKSSINLQANGDGDKDITVNASHTDWTATVVDGAAWLRVNKNGQLATVSVDANTSAQARNGKIRITATEDARLSYDISVSQAGADGILTVSSGSVEFGPEGGSNTIQVTSNSGWSVSGNPGWLKVEPSSGTTPTSGTETKTITLSADENTTKDERSCTLTITTSDNKATATVTVTQRKPAPFILVNGLESASLKFSPQSGVNYKQTVKVTSNVSWSMTGVPEWLSVSPTNGNGEINIDIYPKTVNDVDDKDREAQLLLISGDARATIKVVQETDLDGEAYAKPTNIVTLYNGIAFDYDFGKTVSYYYRGYMEKSAVASMTDAEVIAILKDNFARYTKNDNEVAVFSGLDAGVAYMVYTVGFNKDGKRGRLIKTEVSTKSVKNNEPTAWIVNPTYDTTNWYWSVEKSATCNSYYMISTEDYDFAIADDVYQAWIIDYFIRNGQLSEYLNGGNWYRTKTGNLVAIMTWGLDKNENFSSKISWNYALDSSSSPRKMKKQSPKVKSDKNYPIIEKGKLTIHKRK